MRSQFDSLSGVYCWYYINRLENQLSKLSPKKLNHSLAKVVVMLMLHLVGKILILYFCNLSEDGKLQHYIKKQYLSIFFSYKIISTICFIFIVIYCWLFIFQVAHNISILALWKHFSFADFPITKSFNFSSIVLEQSTVKNSLNIFSPTQFFLLKQYFFLSVYKT